MGLQDEPKIRILCSGPGVVEKDVNELIDRYKPIMWNIQPVAGQVCVTVVLVHVSELRATQGMSIQMPTGTLLRN